MAENPLGGKIKLKPGTRAAVVNAPAGYTCSLIPLPEDASLSEVLDGRFDWIQAFVTGKAQMEALLPTIFQALNPESLLWMCFPKGTSKVQTDLTRDQGWDTLQRTDLKWVTLISIHSTWSAFCLRPYKPGETRQTWWREPSG